MRVKTGIIASVSVLMCGLVLASACGQAEYKFNLAELGLDVSFHTQAQAGYLADTDYNNFGAYGADANTELSRPNPIHFTWSLTADNAQAPNVNEYKVEIATSSSFTNSLIYTTKKPEIDVYNLYIATDYYWRVTAEFSDGSKQVSSNAIFTTSTVAPRNIYVEGVTNVRDMGGWDIMDSFGGGKVKQGMIYRCGRLNKSEQEELEIEITEEGLKTMRDVLGIRSEIDLRTDITYSGKDGPDRGGLTDKSPLTLLDPSYEVNYYFCPIDWNVTSYIKNQENREQIKKVFKYLADADNYPIIYHCNIGTDRTGMIAILLNGLLGVAEEDLYRDYLFSNFADIQTDIRQVSALGSKYLNEINSDKYKGDTINERIENCLIDLGLSKNELDSIRELLTEY